LRWLLWSFLSPSQLLLACVVLGSAALVLGRRRAGKVLLGVGASGLFLFGFLPTASYVANPLETRFPQPDLPKQITGIVLLSGAERPTASVTYAEPQVSAHGGRYITMLRLATRFPTARIVFTGGPRTKPGRMAGETQTAVARQILSSIGIEAARLTFDERSTDTCANAFNTYALVKPKPGENWVVVTSAIHMPRAIACFRAAGWPAVIPQPADYGSVVGHWDSGSFQMARNLELLDVATHEWVGLAYYRLAGRTREFLPDTSVRPQFVGQGRLH
jgi:uncharacterized SAM-binding protein YcdF (DUF218 family)